MSYNPTNQARECLWCDTQIEGRADKQFCSSSCKAHYNRENPKQPPVEPSRTTVPARLTAGPPALVARPQPLPDDESDEEDDDEVVEDWTTKFRREAQEKRDREKAEELHDLYTELAEEFLREDGSAFAWEPLEEFIAELDAAAGEYRHHPGLRIPTHPAKARLADLYLMGDYLREVRKVMEEAEDEAKSFFGKSEPDIVCLELSKKHRKRLRENLLGDK